MVWLLKEPRIGLAGGRRVAPSELAKDAKAVEELEELLAMMEAIETEDGISDEDRGPVTTEHNVKQSAG